MSHHIEPKFKFGEKVRIKNKFFGDLEGTVQDLLVRKEGIWPFRKSVCYYQLSSSLFDENGDLLDCIIVMKEDDIEALTEFKPTVIK